MNNIMKCIRKKKNRWFRLMRRGMISYNSYKLNVKKQLWLLRTAQEKYCVRRLDSFNNDVKRNWNVLNSLMGKNKKSFHKEIIVHGVSTNNTIKICDAFCNYVIDNPREIHKSIPTSTSHDLDQIENNERLNYFWNATEIDIIEPIMRLNKECRQWHRRYFP